MFSSLDTRSPSELDSVKADIAALIQSSLRSGQRLNACEAAIRLLYKYPGCGLTIDQLAALITKQAGEKGAPAEYAAA